jgi:Protein of unknown function (DUF2905)
VLGLVSLRSGRPTLISLDARSAGADNGAMNRGIGPWLVGLGLLLVLLGLLAWTGLLSWFGRLPGDIRIVREHVQVFVPITSMILVSAVLSLVLWLINR